MRSGIGEGMTLGPSHHIPAGTTGVTAPSEHQPQPDETAKVLRQRKTIDDFELAFNEDQLRRMLNGLGLGANIPPGKHIMVVRTPEGVAFQWSAYTSEPWAPVRAPAR